jgi:hypothetical protein
MLLTTRKKGPNKESQQFVIDFHNEKKSKRMLLCDPLKSLIFLDFLPFLALENRVGG